MTDTTTRLLCRLIDEPRHVQAIRQLEPRRFVSLVRSVGLEDAGELLAMATAEQTIELLDTQLWRADPSEVTERLDAARFVVWLEVLLEAGDASAARRVREIPEQLLTAGLCSQLFVLGPEALGHDVAGASWERAELAERVLDETLHLELDGYTLVARHDLGWDPSIAVLLALDALDHELVQRVLDHCHRATMEELTERADEDDALHAILRAHETIEVDALADREDRRARQGYVSLADARAFLALAVRTSLDDPAALDEDPITRACLREVDAPMRPGSARRPAAPLEVEAAHGTLRALVEHVEQLEGQRSRAHALTPSSEAPAEDPALVALRRGMHELAAEHPARHGEQLTRLAYLANVLMTASAPDGQPRSPVEVGDEVLRVVAAALQRTTSTTGEGVLEALRRVGVDALFRLGWSPGSGHTLD